MKTKITISGIRPLLMHNGRLCDALDEHTKAIKKACEKKSKMTESDHEHARKAEWGGSVYWQEGVGFALPGDNIEACFVEGAKKSRKGKQAMAAIFIEEDYVPLALPSGHPRQTKVETFRDDPKKRYELRKAVKVQQSRVMRTRPMIPTGWSASFVLDFDETVLNHGDVIEAIHAAGQYVGIGDWRPKFGRFMLTHIDGKEVSYE